MIKNEQDYQEALTRLDALMDAAPGSPEEEELDLLSYLVDQYETQHFPIELPDPVEAIKFRMQQQGLRPKDLVPYFGNQSKVSEVLNRKRSLSLSMIRALHAGLGIPAEVLLQTPGKQLDEPRYNPDDYPLKDMVKAGYFPGVTYIRQVKEQVEELLRQFFAPLEGLNDQVVMCRNSHASGSSGLALANGHAHYEVAVEVSSTSTEYSGRDNQRELDENALRAWQARVLHLCNQQQLPPYEYKKITEGLIRRIIHLSVFPNGPRLAEQALHEIGIYFVILPHLPHTYLDGACFKAPDGRPVIGMTLRYDRLDNFWFTLAHELTHVLLHLEKNNYVFFDDTEHGPQPASNQKEQEANELSGRLLIPQEAWQAHKDDLVRELNEERIVKLADQLDISPAIIAGRLRWETGNYAILQNLLGAGRLKKIFS